MDTGCVTHLEKLFGVSVVDVRGFVVFCCGFFLFFLLVDFLRAPSPIFLLFSFFFFFGVSLARWKWRVEQ